MLLHRRHLLQALPALAAGLSARATAARVTHELRIGASAALSGPAAVLGQRFHAGARACFSSINRQGGLSGRELVLDLHDDAYEPAQAEANTRALVEDARVLALFGYVGTPTSRVALPYVKRHHLAFVGPYSGADVLREPGLNEVFNVRASYRDEARVLVEAMRARHVRRLRVLYQADLFGRAGMEAVRDEAVARGLDVDAVAAVQRNTTDVDAAAAQLVAAPGPDGLLLVSTYETCGAFIRRVRSLGFAGHCFLLSFTGFEPLRQNLGGELRRLCMTQVVPDPQDRQAPVVQAYQRAMRERGDTALDAISLEGYIAARVLVEALRRVRERPTRGLVLRELEGLGRLDLGGFVVHYGDALRDSSHWVGLRSV